MTAEDLRFERTSDHCWRYRAPSSGRDVDATVDGYGIVVDEPPLFFRVTSA